MGTRGLVTIKCGREVSVFSSHDSYPTALGGYVMDMVWRVFLTNTGRVSSKKTRQFRENLSKIKFVQTLPANAYDKFNFADRILAGTLTQIVDEQEFRNDRLYCEHEYVVDVNSGEFRHYDHGDLAFSIVLKHFKYVTIDPEKNRFFVIRSIAKKAVATVETPVVKQELTIGQQRFALLELD